MNMFWRYVRCDMHTWNIRACSDSVLCLNIPNGYSDVGVIEHSISE